MSMSVSSMVQNWKSLVNTSSHIKHILKVEDIINVLHAPCYGLQVGDSGTYIFMLNGKHLLIHNAGDVYSVIVY